MVSYMSIHSDTDGSRFRDRMSCEPGYSLLSITGIASAFWGGLGVLEEFPMHPSKCRS